MARPSRSTVTPLESLGHPGAVEFSIPRILYYFPKSGIASVVLSHVRARSRMPARGHPGSIAAKSERPPISSFWVRRTTDRLPRLGPRLEQAINSEDADRVTLRCHPSRSRQATVSPTKRQSAWEAQAEPVDVASG
jgi:hypothetical protein